MVADAKYLTLHDQAPRTVYLNALQESRMFAHRFSIRTAIAPTAVAGDVRRLADEVFTAGAVASMTTLDDQVDAAVIPERMVAMLSTMFGILGAALAGLGLYGLLAYTVSRRTNEIGVRMALGATPGQVIAMVVKNAAGIVVAGLLVGIPIAVAGGRMAGGLARECSGRRRAADWRRRGGYGSRRPDGGVRAGAPRCLSRSCRGAAPGLASAPTPAPG